MRSNLWLRFVGAYAVSYEVLYVFGYHIVLKVYGITHLNRMERGGALRVWDEGDSESGLTPCPLLHRGDLGNSETDTLNGYAAFIYDVAYDMGWCLYPQPQGSIVLLTLYHPACAVDMTRDDVTTKARLQGESALKVNLYAWLEQTEGGHAHGLGLHVGSEGGW